MATKLVIYLLFFGLYTVQIGGGQMTSDPAPGRSPGPPGGITTIEDDAHGSSGSIKGTTLLLTKDPTEIDDDEDDDADDLNENDGNNSEASEYSSDSDLSKLNEIKPDEDDLPPSLLEDDEVIPHSGTINVHSDSDTTGGGGGGDGSMNKPCVNELSEFLNDAIVVDKDNVDEVPSLDGKNSSSAKEMFAEAKKIRIKLEVMHDMYDTKEGLNCGLLYRVQLTSSLVDGAPIAGEFFVETISTGINIKKRGHFVEHSSGGNKSPISWLKTPQNDGGVGDGSENWASEAENNKANARARNVGGTFVRGQGVTNTFQPFASQWTENDEKNVLDEDSGMNVDTKCSGDNTWHGRNEIPRGEGVSSTSDVNKQKETGSQNLWILNESCDQDDIVEFRIFFRPATTRTIVNHNLNRRETSSSSSLHLVVIKTVFSFKIAKDCQLTLRETSGTLNHTTLPFYSTDCTVHFPSFQMATLGQLPPGILVELTRLNVPCINGGYLKFSNHSQLCGKLEELSLNERTYHFDVLRKTSVKIYKNPMFSLNYKLVDFCYNVSLNNESGQFYVRPTRPESFECYFRIHLPYGNRIQLQLVTNNDSDVVNSNSNPSPAEGATTTNTITTSSSTTTTTQTAANDRDATTIYTSLGLSIETNIVNLSLSSQNEEVFVNRTMQESLLRGPSGSDSNNNNNNNMYNSDTGFASDESPLGKLPAECHGVVIKIFENDSAKWTHCVNSTSDVSGFFVESSGNTLNVHLFRPVRLKMFEAPMPGVFGQSQQVQDDKEEPKLTQLPSIYLSYATKPIAEIVADCAFGWIALQQFCVSAIEKPQPWIEGEKYCASLGGHLASIRSKLEQSIIDNLLINSPGYHDHFAYWVGGSDKNFEGDFRWTDGLPFQYTNWFPGWSQHGNYNKQPNDDGLSSQDCIELRRYFRTPPGIQSTRSPMTNNFMWNDRDCNANNFIICERPMSDETYRKNWVNDCNKTVSLTKEHPRASVWSPSFPRQYPDNANCFTTITAPSGYRIVLEFEELVIESEQGCTYDYLEVTEPTINGNSPHMGSFNIEQKFTKSSRHGNNNKNKMPLFTNSASSGVNLNTNTNTNRDFQQQRNSYENPSLSFTSSHMNENSFNNFNIAQSNYQNLLNIFSNLYKPHANFLIQTPDYPKGNTYYPTGKNSKPEALPKRLCGDWSSKLKLLRHISVGSYLGLHFVSDYSHHFGGYKAKAFMENSASECANERLRPYNGSCYLFVSYPEADWGTAQQVCNGMGAKLSSVSSADEHKFITSNIRNHIDYSPQLVYWLGAELEKSGQFEWIDDTKMNFQGWLPGQGQFDQIPHDPTCLGLQWKMSPTPMLPSGLYWQSQKCNRVGGYVCKKPKESFSEYALSNSTVMGTEGRLISPAYPNAYPHNIDYWIHIRAPERTRIIVQFQKIDLEAQDECLYDFISIQNYELVSKISLEPGTNPIPMAMFADEREFNEVQYESNHFPSYTRRTRSLPPEVNLNLHSVSSTNPDEDLMDRPKMQMRTVPDSVASASIADILYKRLQQDDSETFNSAAKATAADSNSVRKKSQHPPPAPSLTPAAPLNDNENHANKVLLNPKRHRRKNLPEIENKLPQHRKEEQKQKRQRQQQRHHHQQKQEHHLSKRSTNLRTIPPADNAQSFLPYVRWCGSHDSNMSKFDFVSSSNQVVLNFHSDYSVTGLGFAAVWKAIDMSGCPMQTLTSREGTVLSPNYPHFLLNNLNCAYVIQAPMGRRVWLEFIEYDLLTDTLLEVDIGNGYFRPFRARNHVNEGIFVSIREQIRVQLRTGQRPRGRGFQAVYHTVAQMEKDRVINLTNNFTGYLYQLNYPHNSPENVDFTQHLVAPFGDNILLELHGVEFSDNGCPGNNVIEIYDNYADYNGTKWQLCKYPNLTQLDDEQYVGISKPEHQKLQQQQKHDYPLEPQLAPVYITSYLNTLHIRQRTYSKSDINLNGTVRIQQDNNYKLKLASGDKSVESCQLNPCQFNGKCVAKNGKNHCQCHGHYTGRFCGLNSCELEPCVFGKCELTATNFKCHCQPGYQGNTCEHKIRPCADNPCEGRGTCFERNGGYFCRCHAWWEGHRCERRMLHIPYKPLSERMLQEPFWLGLITVFVVLLAIGLVWCAKRHFPEKIEKLLAEEADRNRPPGSVHGHHHHTSLREQLQFTTAIPQSTTNVAPGAPRSIFNRLGIRKPSLLSLSSPNPTGGATARTFSLDDLLRPPPRRSPSPRKKRNNSTPVKKNAAEKKQILQQLVSPAANPPKPKVSLGELIQMSENRLRAVGTQDSGESGGDKETTFSENSGSVASSSAAVAVTSAINDPKLEKKVTFARLLNKVSAEMSSGSEIDVGHASIFLDLGQNESFMSHLSRESENSTPTEMFTTFKADVHNQMSFKCRLPQSSMQPQQQQQQQQKSPTFLMPSITIDIEPPTPEEKTPRPRDLIIPTLTVEQPSPTKNCFPRNVFPGSPPPQRASIGETSFMFPNKQQQKRLLKQFEKPTSLDLQFVPPTITITSNMSELESDTEPLSPAPKTGGPGSLLAPGNPGMCYLSPFTMCSRADRTISESNLSSSGYSSMASPGPSRCGSSNPLCPNEMDEPGSGHSGPSLSLHASLLSRRKNAALASCKENITNGKHSASNDDHQERLRARSDSETMSDDILLESNDEGIGTDHVDEKLDDNRNNGGQQLGVFIEEQILVEVEEPAPAPVTQMAQLQLPQIVIQIDGTDKGLSPVSSRSESPLSERAGMGRFSPHFYGRKDQLPFTDSDGLYDFPSSDGKASTYSHQRRSSSKKRERKLSKSGCTQSPTKNQNDVSAKDSSTPTTSSHVCSKHCRSYHHSCPVNAVTARKSPKRRPVNRHPVASSSSSSESLTSTKDMTIRSMPRRLNSPNREKRLRKHDSNSEDDAADALLRRISPSIVSTENNQIQPRCKINRLRAIGNQIRFLRRLEKSIKTRERLVSPSDSCAEENTDDLDSPQATSPLLQPTSPNRTKMALCRQNRIPPGTYSLTNSAVLNPGNWKGRDRSIITADVNSD